MDVPYIKVLLIEDNPDDVILIERMLKQARSASFEITSVDRLAVGREYLAHHEADAILLDLSLPDSQGLDTLREIQAVVAPRIAVIILTGFDDYQLGLEAVNKGAQDCLVKGRVDSELLGRVIHYSVERARSAQALLESEHKFRSVVEQSVDGIVLVDEDGLIIEWNRAQERITGLTNAEAVGQPIWDIQFRLTVEEQKTTAHYMHFKGMMLTFINTGRAAWGDNFPVQEIQRPDGQRRLVQIAASVIKTQKGFMLNVIFQDVTEQLQSQQALRQSYLFLQSSLDALSAHIAVLDETGVIISVNAAWRQFADQNNLNDPLYGVGTSYLDVCDNTTGSDAEGAQAVAAGIRQALSPRGHDFYLEYSCHSPVERRWFIVRLHSFGMDEGRRVIVAHYNITERKLAEEALATERNLLQTLVYHLPDRVYAKDRDGRYIFKNPADVHQIGVSDPELVIGKSDFDYYPAELASRYYADDQMVVQFGQPLINREEPAVTADGEQRWILTTKVPLRDHQNQIIGLVGIGRDITERRNTQERLNKLHAEINALYLISKQLGQSLNLETIYSTLHTAIADHMSCDGLYISSYSAEDNIIRCVWAWGDDHQLDTRLFPLLPLADKGTGTQSLVIHTGEALYLPDYQSRINASKSLYIIRSDGSVADRQNAEEEENLPRSALFVPLKSQNQVIGVLQVFSYELDAYSEDNLRFLKGLSSQAAAAVANALLFEQTQREVFERERAEAALRELNENLEQRIAMRTAELRESEARYRAIIEDQTELIHRFLPDATLTFVNDAYCRFFGVPREALIGQSLKPHIFEEDRERWERESGALTPLNPVVTIEYRVIAWDGKIHWVQWTDRLIPNEDGSSAEIQGVGRDITRQRKAEEVLRQALTREMEVNEMRSRFISMASHDLRTPLAIIQAWMDLSSQYGDRLSEERKRSGYQDVHRAIQHMVKLLDDILLIGRAEAGKLEIEPEPIDLRSFCRNLITELKTALGTSHHLNLTITGECDRMWMDPKLLRHIFSNLISNAIKYSDPGSAIEVAVSCARTQVLLSVEDHGIGIPVDEQKYLFEAFFRGSNTKEISGNGLGLAIVQQSVELHGGSITFESRPGEGTTFFVILPSIPLEGTNDEDDLDRG